MGDKEFWVFVAAVAVIIGGSFLWWYMAWAECRETFSFWTCVRMLG